MGGIVTTTGKKRKRFLKRFPVSFVCLFCLSVTVLFFAPSEVILGNFAAFNFSYWDIAWQLIVLCAGASAILAALASLLPIRFRVSFFSVALAATFCCYVQAGFLNRFMGTVTGEQTQYGQSLTLVNLGVWALLFIGVVVGACLFARRKGNRPTLKAIAAVCAALTLLQTAGWVSLLPRATNDKWKARYEYLSTEGMTTLSKGQNTVVFVLDTANYLSVEAAIARYPDFLDGLEGFTYYPDAVSTYSRTYPAMTYLLTGERCYFDMTGSDFVEQAYEKSDYLPAMYENGCDIGLYTQQKHVGAAIRPMLLNGATFDSGQRASVRTALAELWKMALYRDAPYAAKNLFYYDPEQVCMAVLNLPNEYALSGFEERLYDALDSGITMTDAAKSFRLYHFYGAHPGCVLRADGRNGVGETTREEALMGDLTIIRAYMAAMKAAGVYEQSTIIITADHGASGGNTENLELPMAAGMLLLVKPAGASNAECAVSKAPVCQEDLFPTIYRGLGLQNPFGAAVYDIPADQPRERYYYYSALHSDILGEVALREYLVDGDARSLSSYQPTGKWWEIMYSMNIVAKDKAFDFYGAD